MLMTRILLASSTALICALNAGALWSLSGAPESPPRLVVAALIVGMVAWPLALIVAYRIGQVTAAQSMSRKHAR